MYRFFKILFIGCFTLGVMLGVYATKLFDAPPAERSHEIQSTTVGMLDVINRIASWVQSSSDEEHSGQTNTANEFFSDVVTGKQPSLSIVPRDFHLELSEAVHQLSSTQITDTWVSIEDQLGSSLLTRAEQEELIHRAVNLATLFKRDTWHVNGKVVSKSELLSALMNYFESVRSRTD